VIRVTAIDHPDLRRNQRLQGTGGTVRCRLAVSGGLVRFGTGANHLKSCSTRCWSGFGELALTDAVIEQVQCDGICWLGGTTWQGRRLVRISVSNWSTTEADIDVSADAVLAAARRTGAP
jgi:hypothetical protein